MGELRLIRGRVVVASDAVVRGTALVTDVALSLWGGLDPHTGEVIDRHHPWSGQLVTGRVLVLPHGRGSCSASGVLLEAIRAGMAPVAIVTTRVDPIVALGSILGDELYGMPVRVLVVDQNDAAGIAPGDRITVSLDGTISVERESEGVGDRVDA